MPTCNVTLTDDLVAFVESRISSGRYRDGDEVIRAGLHLLEQAEKKRAAKLQRLRDAVQVGLDEYERGEYIELHPAELRAWLAGLGNTGEHPRRRSRG